MDADTVVEKPPIGLMPAPLWKERRERERVEEILRAIDRYVVAGKPIPSEWTRELDELAGEKEPQLRRGEAAAKPAEVARTPTRGEVAANRTVSPGVSRIIFFPVSGPGFSIYCEDPPVAVETIGRMLAGHLDAACADATKGERERIVDAVKSLRCVVANGSFTLDGRELLKAVGYGVDGDAIVATRKGDLL